MNKMPIRGFSLLEILIALGVLGILGIAVNKMLSTLFHGTAHSWQRSELVSARDQINDSLDCVGTLSSNTAAGVIDPAAPGANCNSTSSSQVPPYLRLFRRTANGGSVPLGGNWDQTTGYHTVGDWTIRATCSAAEQSLVVRVARPQGPGLFLSDPLTKQVSYHKKVWK